MKKLLIATLLGLAAAGAQVQAKTLLVYYSFTGNIEKAADAVKDQTPTDVLRIQPAQKGLNYAANNYSLGSDLVDQIRSKPNDAFSYPAIDPVNVDFSKYDTVIIGTPLWWSNMAAPMQTFLFHNGKAMAGKKIGLIVSSASSGISGVERDAKRLIPEGNFTKSLWDLLLPSFVRTEDGVRVAQSQRSGCQVIFSNKKGAEAPFSSNIKKI